jgi:hypothetical protein
MKSQTPLLEDRIDQLYQQGNKTFSRDGFSRYLMEIGANVYEKQILPYYGKVRANFAARIITFPGSG